MIRKIVIGVVFSLCVAGVQAQTFESSSETAGVDGRSMDVAPVGNQPADMDPFDAEAWALEKRAGVTEETVGDPYSFGRKKTYLGVVQTRSVSLRADCTGYPPEGGPCIELNPAPASTFVDETDLGTIELPRRSTKSILCFTFTPFAYWQWENFTGVPQSAEMFLRPSVRIESEVLNDPSLIDPVTGLPFNGVLLDSTITTFLQARTLDPNESDMQYNITTRSCTGGLVNVRALRDSYGLSDAVIRRFFRNPITVTFGVRGDVSMVTSGSYSVGIRLYGD